MDPFIAQVMIFAGNFAPRGWSFCQGQLLAISSNTALFSLIGTMYGGDGRTSFGLPDLRGRAPIGHGRGNGLSDRLIGQRGGVESVVLSELQMPVHNHSAALQPGGGGLKASTSNASRNVPQAGDFLATVNSGAGGLNPPQYPAYIPASNAGTTVELGGVSAGGQIQVGQSGGSQAHENMSPFLAIPYIIAIVGLYPSRN